MGVGALDDPAGRVVGQLAARQDGPAGRASLEQLVQARPAGPLVVVLGHVAAHQSRAVRAWRAAHQARIRPRWLPADAPERNSMERVWRHRKHQLAHHRWWADLTGLQAATRALLDRLAAHVHQPVRPGIRVVQNVCETA